MGAVAVLNEVMLSRKQRRLARKALRLAGKAKKEEMDVERAPKDFSQIEHRLKHDAFVVGGEERGGLTMTTITDPLRIDKMLTAKIIDENQHLSGLQIITLWTIANRPLCGAMSYGEQRSGFKHELGQINRMTAEDQFYRTMMYLATPQLDVLVDMRKALNRPYLTRKETARLVRQMEEIESFQKVAHARSHDLICLICFKEMGVIEAARKLGIAINDASDCVKNAFDLLGEALMKMRKHKKTLEEQNEPV